MQYAAEQCTLGKQQLTVLCVLNTVYWQPVYEKALFKTELHNPIKGADCMNECQRLMKECLWIWAYSIPVFTLIAGVPPQP